MAWARRLGASEAPSEPPDLPPRSVFILLGVIVVIAILLAVVAIVGAPNNMDSMTYHLGRVIHWIQNGSVAFYADGELFSGDLLFAGSVGRVDLPGADWDTLLASVRMLADRLPPETVVHPGHGAETTLGVELARNPFLAELRAQAGSTGGQAAGARPEAGDAFGDAGA